ncbi:hypothetical protein EG327_003790 [Venturia inaequalis]|uniref:Uncharacterized protein n=1 Tax=Venturia inaequalis TaxID=5025 RepID=A0A8H3VEZ9_VENIN|nr:hypothetical protein EG327_003790 [Venturia inaequalis]
MKNPLPKTSHTSTAEPVPITGKISQRKTEGQQDPHKHPEKKLYSQHPRNPPPRTLVPLPRPTTSLPPPSPSYITPAQPPQPQVQTQTRTSMQLEEAELMSIRTHAALEIPTLYPKQRGFLEKHVERLGKEIGNLKVKVLREMLTEMLGEQGKSRTPDVVDMRTGTKKVGKDGGDGLDRNEEEDRRGKE